MLLRINNVIKRTYDEKSGSIIQYSPYQIDTLSRIITCDGKVSSLSSKEMDMIIFLLKNKEIPLTRDQLLSNVWGADYFGSDRVVDDLIKRIRKKVPHFNIETIYGYGYKLT